MGEYFGNGKTFEPTVSLLHTNSNSRLKVASEASEWSASISSKPGSTYILVLAMGASEFYGPNRNGDAFRESELKKKYKTFETNAHVFRSHVNKDPAKSMGSVVKSFYNDDMHRVELVLELVDSKCPDIVDKIRNGETVAVSMGCRIEYDVCTICGNKAPSRKEYCDHLLNELNDIYPDGRIVAADNPDPNFFDISVVYKPADKTGYMLKKVAEAGGYSRDTGLPSSILAQKAAAHTAISEYLSKAADIDKIVTGVGFSSDKGRESNSSKANTSSTSELTSKWIASIVPKLAKTYVSVDDHDIQALSSKNMPSTLATLSDMGIFLSTPEFLDMIFYKITGSAAPEGLASKLISLQGDIFRLLARHPSIVGDIFSSGILPTESTNKDRSVESKMASYLPSRSVKSANLMYRSYRDITPVMHSSAVYRPTTASSGYIKLAAQALAAYRSYIFDCTANSDFSKLACLSGAEEIKSLKMPWAGTTSVALDNFMFGQSNAKIASYSDNIINSNLINLICG